MRRSYLPSLALTCWILSAAAVEVDCENGSQRQWMTVWEELLEGSVRGEVGDKRRLETVSKEGEHPSVQRLAKRLLDEWGIAASDPRLEHPVLIWSPAIDFASLPDSAREVSFPAVIIRGVVRSDGQVEDAKVVRGCGSGPLDERALESARQALFRPARRTEGYIDSEATITIHLDPE